MTDEVKGRIEKGFHQELRGSQGDLSCVENKKKTFRKSEKSFNCIMVGGRGFEPRASTV
jgi:hypothetical protein